MNETIRERLVQTTRRLNEAVAMTAEADEELSEAARHLDEAIARLNVTRLADVPRTSYEDAVGDPVYRWQHLNPVALSMSMTFDDAGVHCRIDDGVGPLRQGPPGLLHGGDAASMLDVALSSLAQFHGIRCVTASLTATYKAPVGVADPLSIEGRIESVDGRKIWAVGEIFVRGSVHVSARALFIELR